MQINYSNNLIDYDLNDKSHITGLGIIKKLEHNFLNECGGRYALATSNCTSSILISLVASGVKQGDDVIISNISWGQTLAPILLLGANPVLCDVKENSFLIDPESIVNLITPKTKAIVASHLFGYPCDLSQLKSIALKHKLKLIIDAAQGFGCIYNKKPIGNFGDFVAFSLGPNKNLSCGEGSVLICNNKDLYENAILFSQHPLRSFKDIDNLEKRKNINTICMNFRLHPLLANIANEELLNYNEFLLYDKYYNVINVLENSFFYRFVLKFSNNSFNNKTNVLLKFPEKYHKDFDTIMNTFKFHYTKVKLQLLNELIWKNSKTYYSKRKTNFTKFFNSELISNSLYIISISKKTTHI